MKICLDSVAASALLAFATAEEPLNLHQVKSDKLSERKGDDSSYDAPKWQREQKWKGDEEEGVLPKWEREQKWKGSENSGCSDPAQAAMDVLRCFMAKDAACVSAAYGPGFQLVHNEVPDNSNVQFSEEYWVGAFPFLDFSFDFKFYNNFGPNQASVRYVQTVATFDGAGLDDGMGGTTGPNSEYPFSQTIYQHEHALIEVDDDCKLVKWDQYGDNKEQTDLTDAGAALFCALGAAPCPS